MKQLLDDVVGARDSYSGLDYHVVNLERETETRYSTTTGRAAGLWIGFIHDYEENKPDTAQLFEAFECLIFEQVYGEFFKDPKFSLSEVVLYKGGLN